MTGLFYLQKLICTIGRVLLKTGTSVQIQRGGLGSHMHTVKTFTAVYCPKQKLSHYFLQNVLLSLD